MKRLMLVALTALCALSTLAQEPRRQIHIREVEIVGQRPMKQIGVQRTDFDSVALKENIALSMADVLTFNSSIFVKSYGRATLSTVAFRGTSASHTQVLWNGMKINSPMLGMTDFSMIPSYFIDDASLLHGTSSVADTGGGLGGSVKLMTRPADAEGFGLQYVQGIGSFKTFDEFLRLTYGNDHWQLSTRVVYSSSPNEYKYRNYDKKLNIYDENYQIIDQYYPTEKNSNGNYRDFHALQEIYYNTGRGDRFGLNAWFLASDRNLPMLSTDYASKSSFENRQREETLRTVFSWDHYRSTWKMGAKAGYIHTWSAYDYGKALRAGDATTDNTHDWANGQMTRSRSTVNTIYGQLSGEYIPSEKWLFTADITAHQHLVRSVGKEVLMMQYDPTRKDSTAVVGYDQARLELSAAVTAKWRPTKRFGMGLTLREELYGDRLAPVIPALFLDGVLSERGNLTAKASFSRNFRFPTLNDLYFLPGGNRDLKEEKGWSYDAGLSFSVGREGSYTLSGSATWFDSYIDDWILWMPTIRGYYTPTNVKSVHAYGVELDATLSMALTKEWALDLHATYSWTPSKNEGEPISAGDRSVGKQLPYVPCHSASATVDLRWRRWALRYKWNAYSERYTLTSNTKTHTGGVLPAYYMSDLSLEKGFSMRRCDLSLKGSVRNLFDEEYLTVLSHPMPGINYEIFIGITPKWGKKRR